MKTAGIIAEYNPLHYGHLHLLQAVRQRFGKDTAVICAMSGDFVQRGDFALLRRYARAEAAVESGADLVLELPLPWAVSSAEGFAWGGVETLTATGLLDVLAFGSECGDSAALLRCALALERPELTPLLKAELTRGDSFAAARQRAVSALLSPVDAALLSQPNNTLGIEYCRALLRTGSEAEVFTVPRHGAAHDAAVSEAGGCSASAIRTLLAEGTEADALSRMVPAMRRVYEEEKAAGRAPVFAAGCERAILSRLRSMSAAEFDVLDTGREGIGQPGARLPCRRFGRRQNKTVRLHPSAADGPLGLSGADAGGHPRPCALSPGAGRQQPGPGAAGPDAGNRASAGPHKARRRADAGRCSAAAVRS